MLEHRPPQAGPRTPTAPRLPCDPRAGAQSEPLVRAHPPDALGAQLARAVAVRGSTRGPLLQRDVASAAQALFDQNLKTVSNAQLNKWLNQTVGEPGKRKKNSVIHSVTGVNLDAINEALAQLAKKAADAEKARLEEEAAKAEAEADDEGAVSFPHKGKHAPPPKLVGRLRELAAATAGKGDVALYKTNDPYSVIAWEDEARENGLTLTGGFTIVYGFDEVVGADHGETTRFVRIDGDHGHPIIERKQGLNTAFDSYMAKEVAESKGNQQRLGVIRAFLASIKVPAATYGLK